MFIGVFVGCREVSSLPAGAERAAKFKLLEQALVRDDSPLLSAPTGIIKPPPGCYFIMPPITDSETEDES
jgi:hypothetical protein